MAKVNQILFAGVVVLCIISAVYCKEESNIEGRI